MRVLFVSAECAPYAKTGGLGDVVGALPKALARRGVDVRVVLPLYGEIPRTGLEPLGVRIQVSMADGPTAAEVWASTLPGSDVPVYFLDHSGFYARPGLYGGPAGDHFDNLDRFAFLSRAALALGPALGWIPDVVHAHDWHAALAPVFLNAIRRRGPLARTASVYSVHNLSFQGWQPADAFGRLGLGDAAGVYPDFEHWGGLNLAKAGLLHATMLTAVSPTYAREIQTPEHGCGLDGIVAARRDALVGILNGTDDDVWNPERDETIAAPFSADDLTGKARCKAALQTALGLPRRPDVPLFAVISRLTAQKGIDTLVAALPRLLEWDLQLAVLGTGDPDLERQLVTTGDAHPDRLRLRIGFEDALAHHMLAGADVLVMPSRFEPCGLTQLYALRYGAVPLVRATGGLIDTVECYDQSAGTGTGFVLDDLSPASIADTIGWALATWWDDPGAFASMRRRGMRRHFTWGRAADAYVDVYRRAIARVRAS